MKLTVLSENAVLYPGLEGEFGLSVYLEEGDTRLLFDAGERDACLRNAEKLGIDLLRQQLHQRTDGLRHTFLYERR